MSHDLDDMWITVPSWNKFQHYKDRDPTWIKLYTNLSDKYEWQRLTLADRGVLVTAWIAYAGSNGVLHVSRMVALCGAHANAYGNVTKALKRLSDAGFLKFSASKPLAQRREELKRREEKAERSRAKPESPQFVAKANVLPADPVKAIAAMIRNGVIHDTIELEAEVRGYHLDQQLADQLRAMLP